MAPECTKYFADTVKFRLIRLLSNARYFYMLHKKIDEETYYPEIGKKPKTKLETESKSLTKRSHMTYKRLLCTELLLEGFWWQGLAGWVMVAGGHVLSCASQLLPSAPDTTAINPPCAKISAKQAHGASAQIFKKATAVKRRRQRWHCWDVVGDIFLEGWAMCQSRHSPEGTVGPSTAEQGHCGGTVSHSKPTLGWRNTTKNQEAPVSCIAPHLPEGIRSI